MTRIHLSRTETTYSEMVDDIQLKAAGAFGMNVQRVTARVQWPQEYVVAVID